MIGSHADLKVKTMSARTTLLVSIAAIVTIVALLAPAQQPVVARKFAVLFGVNDYTNKNLEDLKYAENDVKALAQILSKNGYEVTLLIGDQADAVQYMDRLKAVLKKCTKRDLLMLAFSGHGIQARVKDNDQSFFCPFNGNPYDPSTLVSLQGVVQVLNEQGAGSNLVLVDACRNVIDPNKGLKGVSGNLLAPEKGTMVFFSCDEKQTSQETAKAGEGHGVFFHCVLETLRGGHREAIDKTGNVTWERLVTIVKEQVRIKTGEWFEAVPERERQRPHSIGNLVEVPPLLKIDSNKANTPDNTNTGKPPVWIKPAIARIGDTIEVPLTASMKMTCAWVPPGRSWLGGGGGVEGSIPFKLDKGFWCGQFEVTQEQWQAVMGNNPSEFQGKPKNPVEQVSYDDVQKFLQKVNATNRTSRFLYRLPSAGEWEYILRGGPIPKNQSQYHHYFARRKNDLTAVASNDLSSTQANFDGNFPIGTGKKGPYLKSTSPVGNYLPNPLGMYDMHGNVWEWTSTTTLASKGVLCGGSWFNYGDRCKASFRNWDEQGIRSRLLGFRLLAVPDGE